MKSSRKKRNWKRKHLLQCLPLLLLFCSPPPSAMQRLFTQHPFSLRMNSTHQSNPSPAGVPQPQPQEIPTSSSSIACLDPLPLFWPFLCLTQTEAALGMLQAEISAASSLPAHPAIGLIASRWWMWLAAFAAHLALQGWEWDLMALHTRCCQSYVNDCIRVAGLRNLTLWCLIHSQFYAFTFHLY